MINVEIDFRDGKKLENLIRYIENNEVYGEVQEQVRFLGHHTADKMIEIINANRKRPTRAKHALDKAITAETISDAGGIEVGIGNISKLTAEAPYWEMINDGATYITQIEHIVPFEDGEFRTFKVGSSHIIEGIDYIGIAIRNLDKELKQLMESVGAKFIEKATGASR